MPSWNDIQKQIVTVESPYDQVRRNYLRQLEEKTERNVIAYYSGWLQKTSCGMASIQDNDKDGFMNAIYKMDKKKGLDLILHTPGGDVAATESIGNYLRSIFGTNIRCYIPQLAMSGGTMLACCSECIIMGKESSIGPIDPQFGGIPAYGVIEEFEDAQKALKDDPQSWPAWQVIISKYHPTFIGECYKAIQWSADIASKWLKSGMFRDDRSGAAKTRKVIAALNNHRDTRSHSRHIDIEEAKSQFQKYWLSRVNHLFFRASKPFRRTNPDFFTKNGKKSNFGPFSSSPVNAVCSRYPVVYVSLISSIQAC